MSCVYAGLCSLRDGMSSTVWLLPILHNTWIGGHRNMGRPSDVLRISERDGPHTTPGTGSPRTRRARSPLTSSTSGAGRPLTRILQRFGLPDLCVLHTLTMTEDVIR